MTAFDLIRVRRK